MIFIAKPGGPTLPYPTAAPNTGWLATYPISGSAETNPTNLSRSVIRTRTYRTHIQWGKIPFQYVFIPPDSFARQQLKITNWLAHYWRESLTDTDRNNWAAFQRTALASPNPPTSWRGPKYKSAGWAIYYLINKAQSWWINIPWGPPDNTLTPPCPHAPASWNPIYPTIRAVLASYSTNDVRVWIDPIPQLEIYWTAYCTPPAGLKHTLHPPKLLMCTAGATKVPSQSAWNYSFIAFSGPFDAYPSLLPGQRITVAIRIIAHDTLVPTNLIYLQPTPLTIQP
jgi:hypothetical protein